MTRRPRVTAASVLDPDRHHRADVDRLLDLGALGLVDLLLPGEDVVVAELEHLGRGEHALTVALAEVHVDMDLHRVGSCSLTMRSASSSGIASATWRVLADVCSCSPAADRSTSQSTTVFSTRALAPPLCTSTATTSPGSIGRELAGVPLSTTSPGSSVISRQMSASW